MPRRINSADAARRAEVRRLGARIEPEMGAFMPTRSGAVGISPKVL